MFLLEACFRALKVGNLSARFCTYYLIGWFQMIYPSSPRSIKMKAEEARTRYTTSSTTSHNAPIKNCLYRLRAAWVIFKIANSLRTLRESATYSRKSFGSTKCRKQSRHSLAPKMSFIANNSTSHYAIPATYTTPVQVNILEASGSKPA